MIHKLTVLSICTILITRTGVCSGQESSLTNDADAVITAFHSLPEEHQGVLTNKFRVNDKGDIYQNTLGDEKFSILNYFKDVLRRPSKDDAIIPMKTFYRAKYIIPNYNGHHKFARDGSVAKYYRPRPQATSMLAEENGITTIIGLVGGQHGGEDGKQGSRNKRDVPDEEAIRSFRNAVYHGDTLVDGNSGPPEFCGMLEFLDPNESEHGHEEWA